jgi:hypothetical protein
MEERDCPLCLDPLESELATRYDHPENGTCTGFDIHTSCLADYIHKHLTQHTNLVCTTCRLDLSSLHRPPRGPVEGHPRGDIIARARARVLEERARAQNPFLHIPTGFIDIIHGFAAGHSFINIITTGGRYYHFLNLGMCTMYAYDRAEPYLRRMRIIRGGTRKKGGTKKHALYIIEVRHPTPGLLHKLEHELGIRSREIKYDFKDLQPSSNTADLFE